MEVSPFCLLGGNDKNDKHFIQGRLCPGPDSNPATSERTTKSTTADAWLFRPHNS